MAQTGQSSWNGQPVDAVEIEIDVQVLAERLVHDQAFIAAVATAVRKQLTKDVRTMGNLFGKWAGR